MAEGPKREDRALGESVDPELLRLPKLAIRVGWLLALSVTVFSAYIAYGLRFDWHFAGVSSNPVELSSPNELSKQAVESYYQVSGRIDASALLRVSDSGSSLGQRLVPFDGTSREIWLVTDGDPWTASEAKDATYTGRLRHLADMPFAAELHQYLRTESLESEVATSQALKKTISENADKIVTLRGNTLPVSEKTQVYLDEEEPDSALLSVWPTSKYPDETSWRAALLEAGFLPKSARPTNETPSGWSYKIPAPNGHEAINAKLVEAKFFTVWARPSIQNHQIPWMELQASTDKIIIPTHSIPWKNLVGIRIETPASPVPKSAKVLLLHQSPEDYWYVRPITILLALGAALFAWATLVALRPKRPTPVPVTSSKS